MAVGRVGCQMIDDMVAGQTRLLDLGRAVEALPLQQRALRIHEAALGPDHPSTRQSRKYVEAQ
jgi:hypothetical protein